MGLPVPAGARWSRGRRIRQTASRRIARQNALAWSAARTMLRPEPACAMDTPTIPVLIVDDDPTTAAVLRGLLRNLGEGLVGESTCVGTGKAAREEFKRGVHQLVLL